MSAAITIVGASARAAAQSALRAGLQPFAGDLFADADLARACPVVQLPRYPHGLTDFLASAPAVGWIYTGALENYPQLVDTLAELRPLWGNGGDLLRRVRDPLVVYDVLGAAGINCAEVCASAESLPRDGTWLRKPLRSAGGSHMSRWDRQCRARGTEPGWYFQRRIEGVACSAVFVASASSALCVGATRQLVGTPWTGARGFQYAGSLTSITLEPNVAQTLVCMGQCVAERFALRGLFGVDFILNADGVWPVEINPRYTASVEVLERATGLDVLGLHVAACCSNEPHLDRFQTPLATTSATPRNSFAKAIIYARDERVVTERLSRRLLALTCEQPWPCYADIPRAGARVRRGWPLLSVLAAGSARETVLDALRRLAQPL